jgi:hypothetical protein
MRARCCRCGPTNLTAATRVDWLKRSASAVGWFKTVQVKSPNAHERKALLITRHQLVDMRVGIDNQLRGILKVAKTGKAPVVEGAEWRKLLSSIHRRRSTGARTDRHPHLFLRAHRRGAGDEGGGSPAERIGMDDPATRERRQAFSHAVPARARWNVACLYRGDRRGPHGFPCGECRGSATLDRVSYRQVHRSG